MSVRWSGLCGMRRPSTEHEDSRPVALKTTHFDTKKIPVSGDKEDNRLGKRRRHQPAICTPLFLPARRSLRQPTMTPVLNVEGTREVSGLDKLYLKAVEAMGHSSSLIADTRAETLQRVMENFLPHGM